MLTRNTEPAESPRKTETPAAPAWAMRVAKVIGLGGFFGVSQPFVEGLHEDM